MVYVTWSNRTWLEQNWAKFQSVANYFGLCLRVGKYGWKKTIWTYKERKLKTNRSVLLGGCWSSDYERGFESGENLSSNSARSRMS